MRYAVFVTLIVTCFLRPRAAGAMDQLCDPSFENCRTKLLSLIDAETQEIDVGFWFMEDNRYVQHIVARHNAGVRVRLLVDPRGDESSAFNQGILDAFANAGIPMRKRVASAILHWKTMVFAGQHVVEFSGANYSDNAWVPVAPYQNYVDESIYYTDDPAIVDSFMRKFDDSWIDTSSFADYANVVNPLVRSYPQYAIDADLNFPPGQSYAARATGRYDAETSAIDAIMFRITQQTHADAMIAAVKRGVPVRLITEPTEYRNPARLWDAWNVDRMWAAGVKVRIRAHAGLNHQKSVVLHAQHTVIFGSSNWTSPSDDAQQEHNYFVADKPAMFTWFVDQFTRKWTNATGNAETKAFAPLPPDTPKPAHPKNGGSGYARPITLQWYAGPWAHYYDVYLGTSSSPTTKIAADVHLGPSESTSDLKQFSVSGLAAHTTYYWKVVSRTAAGKTATSAVWSFTTGS